MNFLQRPATGPSGKARLGWTALLLIVLQVFVAPVLAATYTVSGNTGVGGAKVTPTGGTAITSSSTGAYSFTGVPAGTYTLTVSKAGYAFSPSSKNVTVSTANVSAVNFTATGIYTVKGNTGVGGVKVTPTDGSAVTSDASGNYTFSQVPPGTYTLTPSKAGYSFSPSSKSVTVSTASLIGINFTATPVFTVSGSVGVGSVKVTPTGGTAVTSSGTGAYSFTGVPAGTYTLTPSKAGYKFSPVSKSVTVTSANVSGVNFTATAVYSVSGNTGVAGAKVTSNVGVVVTSDASGNYIFTGAPAGTYTLTPSKSGCTFSPVSITGSVTSNITGANFTANCPVALPPVAAIITEQTELRWYDVVLNTSTITMQAGNSAEVIELDLANIHRVKVYPEDPYWFRYYRARYGTVPGARPVSPTVTPYFGFTCFNGYNVSTRRAERCYAIPPYGISGPTDWDVEGHQIEMIGPYRPTGLGSFIDTRLTSIHSIGVTGYWAGLPRISIRNGFNNPPLMVDVQAWMGEVHTDGWGLIPTGPDLFSYDSVYVKDAARPWNLPAGEGPFNLPSVPTPVNWIAQFVWNGDWRNATYATNEFYKTDTAFGLGNDITGNDRAREGYYVLAKDGNGNWTRSGVLNQSQAMVYLKDSKSLVINGSGNSFESGMSGLQRLAQESGKTYSVGYYMAQSVGPASYAAASNSQLRSELSAIYNRTAAEGWKLNIATHSWSGYVTTTQCNSNCQNINHVSFAPASLPSQWSNLSARYGTWNGKGTVVVGNKDILSDLTAKVTQPKNNFNIKEARYDVPHRLVKILEWTDHKSKWVY